MSKYITEFKETGNSTVNVDLICKDWNERFLISTWINDDEEKYTFIVNGKRKNARLCKTQISKEQAIEIADKLNLVHVKDSTFRSGGTYRSINFIKSEVERLTKIKEEKEFDVALIRRILCNYNNHIKV